MDRIFSYSPSRRDRNVSLFRVIAGDHASLLRTISANSVTGYVIDKGSTIAVPKHLANDVSRHLLAHGWSLGV